MLSLTEGTPIAKIIDSHTFKEKKGKHKYLGICDPEEQTRERGYTIDPYQLISEDELEDELNTRKISVTKRALKKKIKEGKLNERMGKEFIINDGMLSPVPNIDSERDVLYVSGPSGSGKSTYIANYLENYCEIYPDNDIYLFTAINQPDPAFEKFFDNGSKKTKNRMTKVVLDQDYMNDIGTEEEINVEDLKNSAVVFDDVDVIPMKKIRDHILELRSRCLEIGRHFKITTCCTTHQLCNYKSTKILLQEATKVVVFPRSGSTYHIKRFLKEYCGMKADDIQRVLNLPSRWVLVNKTYPQYIMYRDGAYLI